MITIQQLGSAFDRNARVVHIQTEGLTHTDSLIQTPYNINCLNWVVGHIVMYRDQILELLGKQQLLSAVEKSLYARESEPIRGEGKDVLRLERLLELLDQGQEQITEGLKELTPNDLENEIQVGQRRTRLSERLFFLYFHDTYHVGQTDLLRQVAGKDDRII